MRSARGAAALLALLGLSCALPALAAPGWETFGPPLNQVNTVSAAPDEDAAVYAGGSLFEASQSALYSSPDGGRTWNALVEAPRGEYYSAVFADPRGGGRVFAASQAGAIGSKIFRSLDHGATWSLILSLSTVCVPSFAVAGGLDTLLFSCGPRLLRTRDAGLTWDEPAAPLPAPFRLASGPGGALLAYGPTQIFRSTNSGDTWGGVGSAPSACPGLLALSVDPGNANAFVAGTGLLGPGGFQCGGVYRSANSGATWTAGSLAGVYVTDVRIDGADPSSVYACASYIAGILPKGGVYRSADGGTTWGDLGLPTTGAAKIALSSSGRRLHAATSLGVYDRAIRKGRVVGPR